MPEIAQTFFTSQSLLTLGGAALGVVVVSKTIRTLSKWDSPWPAFVSLAVCFTGAYSIKALSQPVNYPVSALNACLLFCTALGMNEAAGTGRGRRLRSRNATAQTEKDFSWWSSWLK
jgi:hypothetical protein